MKGRFRLFICVILTASLVGLPKPASAIDADLEGLRTVSILIEELDKGAQDEQITKQMLEDQVVVAIRSKAPKLRYDSHSLPYLYVHLQILSGPSYAGYLTLELTRPVEVLIGTDYPGQSPSKRKWTEASIWKGGYIFKGPRGTAAEDVRSALDRLLESFLAAYYRSNP